MAHALIKLHQVAFSEVNNGHVTDVFVDPAAISIIARVYGALGPANVDPNTRPRVECTTVNVYGIPLLVTELPHEVNELRERALCLQPRPSTTAVTG